MRNDARTQASEPVRIKVKATETEQFIIKLLTDDNPTYDEVCRVAVEREGETWAGRRKAVSSVRRLLWAELITIESDESLWLTGKGWKIAESGDGIYDMDPLPSDLP